MTTLNQSLTDGEIQVVIRAALTGGGAVTEEELTRIVDWAAQARLDASLLGLILDSKVGIRYPDGAAQPRFWRREGG